MNLHTRVSIPKPVFTFSYTDQLLFIGSCFAENIGGKLLENKFTTDINPFGILYNPASVASALQLLIHREVFTSKSLFNHDGVFHSFMHHSRFSAVSETDCLENINNRLAESSEMLKKTTRLVVTFGTSYIYRLKDTGQIVANCHKLPEKMFERNCLSVEDIVEEWKSLLPRLWEQTPELKVLFTVSPIRHWKDGAHGNQLSKAKLLIAIESLEQAFPNRVAYFPAYEIMLDELRDYRFYADDMLHPSPLAIEYIWERFKANYFSKETLDTLNEWEKIRKAISHKPFHPESETYTKFLHQTLLKMEQIQQKFPSFDIADEVNLLKSKL